MSIGNFLRKHSSKHIAGHIKERALKKRKVKAKKIQHLKEIDRARSIANKTRAKELKKIK